jgi:putative ATP-binding cassette transporter
MSDQNLKFNRQFFKDFWQLLKPYWVSEEKWSAFALLSLIIVLIVVQVKLNIGLNTFYKNFYNALQGYDKTALIHSMEQFCLIALALILAVGYNGYLNGVLGIRWRRWLTKNYLTRWLQNHTYYRMQALNKNVDNPDQRISEDLDSFSSNTISLFTNFLNSGLTLFYFGRILWMLSGPLTISLNRLGTFHVSGYLFWAALLFAAIGTPLNFFIGRFLAGVNYFQQRFNADFRFGMVRLRESSEQVALYRGEEVENIKFNNLFARIFANYMRMVKIQKSLTFFQFGYNTIANIFGALICLPLYFAKKIKLGEVMQISSAFGQVIGAFSILVNSYTTLAAWRSVIHRLAEFNQTMAAANKISETTQIHVGHHKESYLEVDQLQVELPEGEALLKDIHLKFEAGESILITGLSGSGKSTLLRTLAGIWPYGNGKITLPPREQIMFLPQKPYLPIGSLRDVLLYPYGKSDIAEKKLMEILALCGLEKLQPDLDNIRHWSHELSLGEQQLCGFARIFLQKPQWVFLDEATSALDEAAEIKMYKMLRELLPTVTVISVGHRSTLYQFHTKKINVVEDKTVLETNSLKATESY